MNTVKPTDPKTAAQRAAEPSSNTLRDEHHRITPPLADPTANSTATPVPPAKVDHRIDTDPPVDMVGSEPVPDPVTMSAEEQNRIEVLTGKRLQREAPAVADADPKKRAAEAKEQASHKP